MRLIDPSSFSDISKLQKHEIVFPKIEFVNQVLHRRTTTLKAAYTNITKNHQLMKYFAELKWDTLGDINWQNQMLNTLSENIFSMIANWKDSKQNDDELLKKIFLYIQLWGGNTSRGFFTNNGGFENNFSNEYYKNGSKLSIANNIDSLSSFLQLNQVGISFATKHMFFWSNKQLPIYDNIIAMLLFGRRPGNNVNHYSQYIGLLNNLGEEHQMESHIIERSIFNWADTENGKKWYSIRKQTLKKNNKTQYMV